MSWYDQIEERVREIIYTLRNNGINTTNSNEKGYIEAEWQDDSDVETIFQVCHNAGYKLIRLDCVWTTFPMPQKYIKIHLYDKKFGNVPDTYIPKSFLKKVLPEGGIEEERLNSKDVTRHFKRMTVAYHSEVIRYFKGYFPEMIFVSQFDERIRDEIMPTEKGKQMMYVLNYDLNKEEGFSEVVDSLGAELKDICFYKLTKEQTQKQIELFKKLKIL